MGLYDVVQYRMADVYENSNATEMRLDLDTSENDVRLTIWDDGVALEAAAATRTEYSERMERLAADMGGDIRISASPERGTTVAMSISGRVGERRLDQTADRR